jgi:hypothetical protein
VTNFWDPAQMPRETEIGTAAVQAARAAGVKHLIWSTLPDSEKLTGGRVKVAHFTGKARVDAAVKAAGFARHTFVMAPMYFQNFLTMMVPMDVTRSEKLNRLSELGDTITNIEGSDVFVIALWMGGLETSRSLGMVRL